jgi:FdhD protein
VPVARIDGEGTASSMAEVVEEVPVAFVYRGRPHAVMMATPADVEDLAIGFTLTEGIVARAEDVGRIVVERHSRGIEIRITIPDEAADRLDAGTRALAGRTGCGLCGVEAIDDAVRAPRAVASGLRVGREALWRAADGLDRAQPMNRDVHALHAAAWADPSGTVHVAREDVGRHNALDKVVGALAREGRDPGAGLLVLTSRASFELVQKAAMCGVPLLAAVSRPTALAIRMAETTGLCLVGLLRGRSAFVYAHPERMID